MHDREGVHEIDQGDHRLPRNDYCRPQEFGRGRCSIDGGQQRFAETRVRNDRPDHLRRKLVPIVRAAEVAVPGALDRVLVGVRLDPASHRVTAGEHRLVLSPAEFKLLHFLLTHPGRVYSRAQLLDQVWGDHVYIEERTVDVHVRRLRKALEPSGYDKLIDTVRGAGYGLRTA